MLGMPKPSSCYLLFLVASMMTSACAPDPDVCGDNVRIEGTEQSDQLSGESANECIVGLGGNDILEGGDGDDILIGGDGTDLLSGGAGNDTFVVGLGSKMDLIADSSGTDTIVFAKDIQRRSIAALDMSDSLNIQIEQDGHWTYVSIPNQDGLVIEQFQMPNGDVMSGEELLASISNDVLGIREFNQKLIRDSTIAVSESDPQNELYNATAASVRNNMSTSLCIRPESYPRPDELGERSGINRPDEHFAVFYNAPTDERSLQQRKQYRALAKAGVMARTTVTAPNGKQAEKFTLTVDGWAYMDNQSCIHYAKPTLKRVVSYLPTGREQNGAEFHAVKAEVGVIDVELWARLPAVLDAFPKIAELMNGNVVDVVVLKRGDQWIGSTPIGYPIQGTDGGMAPMPSNSELLAVQHIDRLGTLKTRELCVRLPMLGQGQYQHPESPWVTSMRDPYRGGNVESINETRRYLDALVNLGVATTGPSVRTARATGKTYNVIEYRFQPQIRIIESGIGSGRCMPVATLEFDLIYARRKNQRKITVRGIQHATPLYPWVRSPEFLSENPAVAKALRGPQPATGEISIAEGAPLKMNYWTIPN